MLERLVITQRKRGRCGCSTVATTMKYLQPCTQTGPMIHCLSPHHTSRDVAYTKGIYSGAPAPRAGLKASRLTADDAPNVLCLCVRALPLVGKCHRDYRLPGGRMFTHHLGRMPLLVFPLSTSFPEPIKVVTSDPRFGYHCLKPRIGPEFVGIGSGILAYLVSFDT
ncbi:hypothetical protein SCLCIDRAFT_631028 [Scleroderma citrinum Foug A]|uniref:Uncharacterized protein n=1 Tax=Scleroderma citrinum Foug A TaxID=1036808 RepID=A0A0C3E7K6_9AGAM|nr:hypothetical protein SCLCIDRAFT_631028 [Scleroderma citrinum Foug A]